MKRGKSVADAGLTHEFEAEIEAATPTAATPSEATPTEAIVVYLAAYRRERARSLGYRPASHSAS